MDSTVQISQELEELIQNVGDETFSIRTFNNELNREIDTLRIDEKSLVDYIYKCHGNSASIRNDGKQEMQ